MTRRDLFLRAFVVAATLLAFRPVVANGFVNWDDAETVVHNDRLDGPGVAAWAFTTTHMDHYQPLAWLAWAALRRCFGPSPAAHHAASLALHAVNAALVLLLARRLLLRSGLDGSAAAFAATAAALLFAIHPLRVEPVAWASAFPYLLATGPLLASALAYVAWTASGARRWWWLALLAYATSLLCRPAAPAFPLVLLCLDLGLRRRLVVRNILPFALVATAATAAESSARHFVGGDRLGFLPRLSAAAAAPFVSLGKTLVPVGLTPLDPLPLEPRVSWPGLVLGGGSLVLVTLLVMRARSRRPWLAAAWLAYLLVLAPAAGLAPTGLQATADRYTYLPGVAVSLAIAGLLVPVVQKPGRWIPACAALALAAGALGIATWRQCAVWRDSVTLWGRAVAVDPHNDVALYNLAAALAEAGDEAGATRRYEETLRLVPDHAPARRNLSLLEAARLEREGDALATAGRLAEAAASYGAALERDGARPHARAARGIALARLGRYAEAAADLAAAVRDGNDEPEVASALGIALVETGRPAEARRVLSEALGRHPGDVPLGVNLARLLASSREAADRAEAVRLAGAARDATGGQDPRVLATLASAYAAAGRRDLARQTAAQAADLARRQGDAALAAAIESDQRRR